MHQDKRNRDELDNYLEDLREWNELALFLSGPESGGYLLAKANRNQAQAKRSRAK